MDQINYEDFLKVEMRSGTIIKVEAVPKSKLLKLEVNFGLEIGCRTILAGIGKDPAYQDNLDVLLNKQVVAVLNLAPREMKGIMSHGMILACIGEFGSVALVSCPGAADGALLG
jgi:methionine--tRNA ligase beta chain